MKNITILLALLLTDLHAGAQDFLINFTGTGSATTVDSVRVDNLSQGTFLTMSGSDILNLKGAIGIAEPKAGLNQIVCYPNPMVNESQIEFYAPRNGLVNITVYGASGREVINSGFNTCAGIQRFSIAGLNQGFYLVHLSGEGYAYNVRLISTGSTCEYPRVNHQQTDEMSYPDQRLKQGNDITGLTVVMQYNNGDVLKLTGKSGLYQTVYMLIPTQGQSVSFPFTPCVDGSGNNYSTVKIGTQIWMAGNLRTTSLNTTASIQNIIDPTAWANTTLPAYALYQNDNQYLTTYGLLYNGYAAMSGNLCPCNWHVSTDAEWTTMEIFLENNGYNYDGFFDTDNDRFTNNKIAKSLASNSLWGFSPNDGAIGNDLSKNNRSGFSAQAGGYRFETGNFDYLNMYGFWWTSTSYSGSIIYRALYFTESDAKRNMLNNRYGFSVRCIKD